MYLGRSAVVCRGEVGRSEVGIAGVGRVVGCRSDGVGLPCQRN